ncbi:Dephospho-CoA kinase [Giardia duodenalis]|uniref:Dephospho-CoA kinase n=1 Tax=Giardia intestinalis TaxID=5741 RepID=V6TFQ3_GIAIN|nr:Dephospho-CoA kinase [Giardia intestinalis]
MRLFVLTGAIGCGKSTFASFLNKNGVAIIDTDVLSHQVAEPGMPGHAAILAQFGPSFFSEDVLDRKKLADHVFSDATGDLRRKLEQCTHPYINSMVSQQLRRIFLRQKQTKGVPTDCVVHASPKAVCVVIPLYFEVGLDKRGLLSAAPVVACVLKSVDVQIARLKSRSCLSLDEQEALARISHQMSMEEKASRASYVVENDGPIEELEEHAGYFVTSVMPKLKSRRIALPTIIHRYFEEGFWNLVLEVVLLLIIIARLVYKARYGGKSPLMYVLDKIRKPSDGDKRE